MIESVISFRRGTGICCCCVIVLGVCSSSVCEDLWLGWLLLLLYWFVWFSGLSGLSVPLF